MIFGYTNKYFCVKISGIGQIPFAYYLNAERGVFLLKYTVIKAVLMTISAFLIVSAPFLYFPDYEIVSASSGNINKSSVILLDAGHGGEDPGAIGYGDVYEKDLNLAFCKLICEELTSRGYTVVMTREEDRLLYTEAENIKGIRKISDLKNRVKIFNSYESAIAVSIHMNTFSAPQYHGTQIYYSNAEGASNLAAAIIDSVRSELR